FSVEDNPCSPVSIVNRLLPALQIDDRQTTHRQTNAIAQIKSIFIGAAMTNGLVHAAKQTAIDRRAVNSNNSGYAAHLLSFILPTTLARHETLALGDAKEVGAVRPTFLH